MGAASVRWSLHRRRRSAPIAATATATISSRCSRLTPLKRSDLILRALAERSAAGIRCVLAGEGREIDDDPAPAAPLQSRAACYAGSGASTMPDAIAPFVRIAARSSFAPRNEDYGFVTVEAFSCAKPVLTWHDSGGPAELVGTPSPDTSPPDLRSARPGHACRDDRSECRDSPRRGRRQTSRSHDVGRGREEIADCVGSQVGPRRNLRSDHREGRRTAASLQRGPSRANLRTREPAACLLAAERRHRIDQRRPAGRHPRRGHRREHKAERYDREGEPSNHGRSTKWLASAGPARCRGASPGRCRRASSQTFAEDHARTCAARRRSPSARRFPGYGERRRRP